MDLDKHCDILLKLVKIGLGNVENLMLPENLDWKKLISLSYNQGVSAIVCDGMQVLYENQKTLNNTTDYTEQKEIRYEWISCQLSCEQYNEHYQTVLSELVRYYNENGFRVLLLKGYGLCLNYPNPTHRFMGDIDCYLSGNNSVADELIEKEYKIKIDHSSSRHSAFSFKNVMVENHFALMDDDAHWTNRHLEKVLENLLQNEPVEGEVRGQKVYFPSPTFNALYLIRHAGEHFAKEKITLRHVLDWGLFVKKQGKNVDWNYVYDLTNRYGGVTFMDSLNAICVKYLGFESSLFAAVENSPMVEKVLNDILCPKQLYAPSGRLKYALWITRLVWNTRWKYNIVYNENIIVFILVASIHKIKEWCRSC